MAKINALSIQNLRLPEEMAYYHFVVSTVTANSIVSNRFATPFGLFKTAYDYQNELYMRHDRKVLTQEVQGKEALRDKWIRKLRNNVREVVEFGAGEKKAAAEFLSTIIEEYGGAKIPDMKTEAETGVLLNLYEDLQEKYADKLELLNLTAVVEGAKQANQEFIEAQNARLQSDADYGKGKLEAARPVTAKKYRYFIDSVNLEAEIDGDGELTPFIDFMNAKIDEMRKLAGQGSSPSTGSGGAGSEGGGSTSVPVFKNATFKFVDGTALVLPFEVGTPIEAPANTAGYIWKPTPELMPKTNRTFNEVPIEENEPGGGGSTGGEAAGGSTGGEGGGQTGGGSTETQGWPVINPDDPTEYEARFYDTNTDFEDFTARVNTPLEIPAAPEGLMWPVNMPSVMPPCNFRAYAMPADSDITTLYRLEYKDGDTVLRTDYLPAGSIVFLYPAPDGKTWHHVPDNQKMPARDVTLTTDV